MLVWQLGPGQDQGWVSEMTPQMWSLVPLEFPSAGLATHH